MTQEAAPGRSWTAADLVGVAGLVALGAGLASLRSSSEIGFDPGAAWAGVVGELSVTLPAAVLVLAASLLELAAGLVLARWLRTGPFESLAEAAIAALAATTLKGALLIGSLGAVGLYRAPFLIAIDAAIVALALLVPALRAATWPLLPLRRGRDWLPRPGSIALAVLVAIVWAGPVVLQLASPVVPFIDVLPNYVGPAEHLRTFGILSPLTETQSPIIGPSRSVLGYDALLGGLATMTGLPGVLAAAAWILPSMLLVAAGVQRLAVALSGDDTAVGPWALLAFAVTEPFARLGDARGTVIVLPLVAFALALAVERARGPGIRMPAEPAEADALGAVEAGGWRWEPGLAIGLGLGASILVHPVIGAFAVVTVAVLTLARPERLAPTAFVAGITAGIAALPQLGVMLGRPVPTPLLAAALVASFLVGAALARLVTRSEVARGRIAWLALWARPAVAAAMLVGIGGGVLGGVLVASRFGDGLGTAGQLLLDSCGVLLVALALGWLVRSDGASAALILVTTAVGLAAVVLTQMLPDTLGFLGDALRFEVPKTVHYWIPTFVAIGAGAALAKATAPWRGGPTSARIGSVTRLAPIAAGAIVVFAAYPLRTEAIDPYHLGEHRLSEAVAIDLHYAGSGFWVGFPDSRTIVDPPRQAIVDVIRAEIDAGRIRHDTPILHVARSFQEWVSTPLGVFDGVTETFASPDQEVSHQTVGGRLYNLGSVHDLLVSGSYPYVVLEPNNVPTAPAIRADILANGYRSIFVNDQGEVFVRP